MFGGLKSRLIGRHAPEPPDEDAIRAHVLGEMQQPGPPPFPPRNQTAMSRGCYDDEFEGVKPGEIPTIPEPNMPMPENEFARDSAPREFERKVDERGSERGIYEILDRLSVIEAQLATVRAQTETLNERMKILDMYIRNRTPRTMY